MCHTMLPGARPCIVTHYRVTSDGGEQPADADIITSSPDHTVSPPPPQLPPDPLLDLYHHHTKVKSSLRSVEPNFIQMPIIIDVLWSIQRNIPSMLSKCYHWKLRSQTLDVNCEEVSLNCKPWSWKKDKVQIRAKYWFQLQCFNPKIQSSLTWPA